MFDLDIIAKNDQGSFELGKNRANLSTQTLKKVGLHLIEKYFKINTVQKQAFQSTQRPIVILPKVNCTGLLAFEEIAPDLNQIGVLLPYSAILQLLATKFNAPMIATSGNLHGSPILSDNIEAEIHLQEVTDY